MLFINALMLIFQNEKVNLDFFHPDGLSEIHCSLLQLEENTNRIECLAVF